MSSYDAVPYPGGPVRQAHPARLEAFAALSGLHPAPVANCRVLELGCSDGGNLTPIAELLPDSRFVGIDNSSRQIEDGRALVQELGLTNIRLECRDLMDSPPDLGEFDYILCHGVYSWVPPPVQERILGICAAHLAPQGVAFVSYNTYPGWHLRGMVREMMLYHVSTFDDPQARIDQSQAFLDFLVRFVPSAVGPYATFLANEMERLRNRPRTYLFHEHLESTNLPLYFHEFMERAAAAGLQYLGDDNLPSSWTTRVPQDAARLLAGLGSDIIRREQYLDFLQGSSFRRTLLCRAGTMLHPEPDPDVLRRGYLSACLNPATPIADLRNGEMVEFRTPEGPSVDLGEPLMKAAAVTLGESWPNAWSFAEIQRLAVRKLSPDATHEVSVSTGEEEALLQGLLRCVAAGLVEFRLTPERFVSRVSEAPRTTRLARRRAELGLPITNAVHGSVVLNEIHCQILKRLDGRHDVNALVDALEDDVRQGTLSMAIDGVPLEDEQRRRDALTQVVQDGLSQFARQALLAG